MAFGVNVRAEAARLDVRVEVVDYDWSDEPRMFCYLADSTDRFLMVGTPEEVKTRIEAMGAAYRAWEEAGRPAEKYEASS